jgi:hypothetical protein
MSPTIFRQSITILFWLWAAILLNYLIGLLLFDYQIRSWPIQIGIPVLVSLVLVSSVLLFPDSFSQHLPRFIGLGVCLLSLINIGLGGFSFQSYGDNTIFLLVFVQSDDSPMPRWLVGIELLRAAYAALWKSGPFSSLIPAHLKDVVVFVQLSGILAMAAGTYLLHKHWPGKLALALPALSPLWLMFSSGYIEYYPFIVCIFLGVLLWFFDGDIKKKSYQHVALLLTTLPLIYLGFAPFSAMILICYLLVVPERRIQTIAACIAAFVITVSLFWKERLSTFFDSLYHFFSDDDKYALVPQYKGLSSTEDSIFFSSDYALSLPHFNELFYMVFWGNGLIPLFIALAGAIVYVRRSDVRLIKLLQNPKVLLACFILIWQAYYTVFMIPFLGPSRDIDLFFVTYLMAAFMGGMLWDRIFETQAGVRKGKLIIISLTLGNTISLLLALLVTGIPEYR